MVKYYDIYDLFVSTEKNCLILGWLLLFRTRPFNLHVPARRSYLRKIPGKFIKIFRVTNLVFRLFLLKNVYRKTNNNFINVPFDGHVVLETSEGYKVFDLKRRLVATQYNKEHQGEIFDGIAKKLKEISKYDVSSTLKSIDYQRRCIYEEYLNLYKANNFYPFSTYFNERILPIWERNKERFPKRKIDVKTYILNQESFILKSINQYKEKGHSQEIVDYIRNYTKELSAGLLAKKSINTINLSLTHGDMHYKNILLSKKDGLMIDCNTIKERSIFHDFFYMLFYNLFKDSTISYHEFADKLDACFAKIAIRSQGENSELGNQFTIHENDFYRRLFYLEYVSLAFEFNINIYNDKDQVQEGLSYYYGHIKLLKDVESNISSRSLGNSEIVS